MTRGELAKAIGHPLLHSRRMQEGRGRVPGGNNPIRDIGSPPRGFGVLSLRLFGWRFYPLVRGADESGAAKFLVDLRGPPDFFLAITVGGGDRVVE